MSQKNVHSGTVTQRPLSA